jgi:hypothetical protein
VICTIKKYQDSDLNIWNNFIAKAKNATFLFHRNFMEYHKDRFEDFSLLVFEDKKLVAVVPANKKDDEFHSHQGLTYGGVVVDSKLKLNEFLNVFESITKFLKINNFKKAHFKIMPNIYQDNFSDELLYALFLKDAKLVRRDTLAVIDYRNPIEILPSRLKNVKKSEKYNLEIRETSGFTEFWNEILVSTLNEKHHANPVHSVDEIKLLCTRFPDNIKQFNVYHENKIVAGTTIFETKNVAHSQYIGSNADKNKLGSLDFLYDYLIKKYAVDKKYFDFGISNENNGRTLNEGLSYWKESFGAKTVIQDFYELEL